MSWETIELRNLCKVFQDGDWIESKDQSPSGIRLIQTGNVGVGYFRDKSANARYISAETFIRLNCNEIFPGDCLVSRLPDPVGRACLLPDLGSRMITAVDCTILRFDETKINPLFFKYYTQSNKYLCDVDNNTTGTTRKRISKNNLSKIKIPLPPLPEQQRIVEILDQSFASIDQAIENTEKNIEDIQLVLENYLQSMFSGENSEWNEKRLDEIADIKGGKRVPKGYKLVRTPTGHPYIRVTDFNDHGSVNLDDIHYVEDQIFEQIKRYTISTKDLYISIAGTIGKSGIIPEELDGANLTENACKLVFKTSINPKFIYYFTKSNLFMEQAGLNTRVAAMPKLALSRLGTIKLSLPSDVTVQNNYVKKLDAISNNIQKLQISYNEKIIRLQKLKQSILYKAFNGDL